MAHMHYTGTGRMHSFRGLLEDGGQQRIRIQGSVGAIAWRITKFQAMGLNENQTYETSLMIFREFQDTLTTEVNFDDDELLGALLYGDTGSSGTYVSRPAVIFDNALFVRNIYITHSSIAGDHVALNYYLELEEVKVSAAGIAQLSVAAARRVVVTD